MKNVIFLTAALFSMNAHADGFKCEATRDPLLVKVYNHTNPEEGTRNASVMVLSDSSVQAGNKTIARFTDVNETLSNRAANYVAKVDLRYNDSGRKGELLAGTKLGYVKSIVLNVDFSYGKPEEKGAIVPATLTLIKRNGDVIDLDMNCERYLKGE